MGFQVRLGYGLLLVFAHSQYFYSSIFVIIVPLCQTNCPLRTVHLIIIHCSQCRILLSRLFLKCFNSISLLPIFPATHMHLIQIQEASTLQEHQGQETWTPPSTPLSTQASTPILNILVTMGTVILTTAVCTRLIHQPKPCPVIQMDSQLVMADSIRILQAFRTGMISLQNICYSLYPT